MEKKPIRDFLKRRPTLIIDKPLIGSSSPKEVKRDPKTDTIVEVHGKTVYAHVLPDWIFSYVEFKTEDEKVGMRRVLSREEDVSIIKVTDHRIYFEEKM